MLATAGRILAPAVLLTALVLSPALGYATTFVLLIFGAVAAGWWAAVRVAPPSTGFAGPPPPQAGEDSRWHDPATRVLLPLAGEGARQGGRGEPHAPTLLFALAFALIALSTLLSRADATPLLSFSALLLYSPLHRLLAGTTALPRLALIGTGVGLLTTFVLHFILGQARAGEGFVLTDPYRLAVTTLMLAVLALGALFTNERARWLAPLGLVAAVIVIGLTGSRTALLGLPVLLLVTALCFVRRPVTIVAVLVVTVALLGAALFVELPGTARTRLWDVVANVAQGGEVGDVAIALRLHLYRFGFEQFWASPLFGHGWSEANMGPILARFTPEQLSWGKLVHLHNDALQFALSGGLLGLTAWLAILAAPLVGHFALPREARTATRLHAVLVLVVGYLVLGLPDLMLGSPLQLTLYVVLTAAVLGNQQSPPTSSPEV